MVILYMACKNILITVYAMFLDKTISNPILHWTIDKIKTVKESEFVFPYMVGEDLFTTLKWAFEHFVLKNVTRIVIQLLSQFAEN